MSALEQHTNEKEARTPPHVGSQDGSSNEDLERSPKGFKKDGDVRDDLVEVSSTADSDEVAAAARVKEAQEGGTIKYRTLSWQKAAILLFTEYVCLAILAFPWAFSYLGMAGGLLATLGVGLAALYTSLILWRYCLKHPHILNICDIGYQIFGKSKIAYELTALALVLNNVFIMGLHTLTGSEILNTLSNHGHIMYPTFIAEMKDPREFPKALYAVTVAEFVLFSVTGIVGYRYTGQYTTAPAVGTLRPVFKKIAFAFVLPTTIIIGVLYASVVAKYLFSRLTMGTKHYNNHTVLGWTVWVGCVTVTWVLGWVIGEAVPFFGSLLSLMSALFDCYFGYIFWAFAFFELNKGQLWVGQPWLRKVETAFQYVLILAGLFILGPGLYASVQSIIDNYATGSIKAPFTCANNAL
uniref:Amino acid transporter transmembrane domain-containing protein n=1 Tax=Kalmanozyma brasiliensis (strain GHG001) TaxID=1365824 RepID=V5E481_KALBG